MGKYLDPKADLTFKKVFGKHKHLVISLLNALLPLKDDARVESVEYWPAERIPERTEVEKYSVVDVCCKDNHQREFIVEMQMSWTESFKKRVLLNASKAYVEQSTKGMSYKNLQPVYALNFVNAVFQTDVDDYYHYYHLVHDKHTDKVIDGLHLVFVELPKFTPQNFSERKMQVLWLRFLTEINDKTQEAPAELLENEDVKDALEIVERAAFNDIEMRAYDKFWDIVSTQRTWEEEIAERAEEAEAKVEAAEAKAEEAESKAKVAEAKAEVAESKAKVAESKAKVAESKAKVAESKAEEAEAKAEVAEAKAKEAKAEAEETRQKLLQTARNLKSMNIMTTEQIAAITGLSNAEIEDL